MENQTAPIAVDPSSHDVLGTCKFWECSVVRHKKGTEYIIVETPRVCRIEAGNVPAYAYRERYYDQARGSRLWVRPQNEMEDGRFEMVDGGPYGHLYGPNGREDNMMTERELKTEPQVFDDVVTGRKTFEIRKDDRGHRVDETLKEKTG